MTGVKKESHQRKPSPRRQRQLPNVAALSKASSDPDHDDGGGIISRCYYTITIVDTILIV